MRLDKLLEKQKVGSRKAVKRLFQRRLVTVDEQVVMNESMNVEALLHRISVSGRRLDFSPQTYLMLNKPQGVVTAVKDKQHRTVIDLVQEESSAGLYPIGRLDRDTEGLLLLTDNGQLGYQLMQPSKKVTKRYEVRVNAPLNDEDQRRFEEGIVFIGGVQCQPAALTILSSSPEESRAYLDIQEGKFHQVKKMFLAVGKKVIALKRLSMGPIQLDASLKPGEYRALTIEEMQLLKPYFC